MTRGMVHRIAAAALFAMLTWTDAAAQTPHEAHHQQRTTSSQLPRTIDGHPSLEGYWIFTTVTPLERPEQFATSPFFASDQEATEFVREADDRRRSTQGERLGVQEPGQYENTREFTEVDGRKVTALIFDPRDGRIPYIGPRAQQAPLEERYDSAVDIPLAERCVKNLSGAPLVPAAGPSIVQIFQSPDHLVLLQEYGPELRVIPFDSGPHPSSGIREWTGHSRGHWEGDTLVIDTTNFRDGLRQRRPSSRFDENLHLVERFTLLRPGVIWYEFTVDDPTLFTQPWSAHFSLRKKDAQVFEFACHEGNYSLSNMLRGARAQEASESR